MIDDAVVRIDELCAELLDALPDGRPAGEPAATIVEIRNRLTEPLRVAIGGRLKAGKSTLVNALVGEQIAPTDVGECTRLVTWYRFGDSERIEIERTDGPPAEIPLVGRRLPETLGVPEDRIERVTVWLRIPALREMTIIDTPGLETLSEQYAANTRTFLGIDDHSRRATTQADALIYLMPHLRETDEVTLEAFRDAFPSGTRTALNTVGVLSRIDTLSDDDDPWPAARRQAEKASRQLGPLLAAVVPVVGLLAETVGAGLFTESDAINVAKLAAADPLGRARALIGLDQLRAFDGAALELADRERLARLLGLYGLRQAVGLVDAGATSAGALADGLRAASGIDPLRRALAESITARADLFKVDAAASALTRLALGRRAEVGAELSARIQETVEQIRLDPEMHQLAELDLLRELAAGTITVPDDLAGELQTLLGPGSAATRLGSGESASGEEVVELATRAAAHWNAVGNDLRSDRATQRAARVANLTALHLLRAARAALDT